MESGSFTESLERDQRGPILPPLGPWPLTDTVGFTLAIGELQFSLNNGKNVLGHLQFDTVRKLCTTVSHIYESSTEAAAKDIVTFFRAIKGELFSLSSFPTQSRLFTLFTRGLLLRMGKQTKVNKRLDYRVLLELQTILKAVVENPTSSSFEKRDAVLLGAFLIFGSVLALRGNEVFMIESFELAKHIEFEKKY